ncbi:MAG: response regulator [Candidatus Thiodiazotropha sp. (ex Monitilora ramsayi)]|nr:response regulator [Candidatus Thiodiazotropha sp. (ex Monitilora ramsayi)]
MRYIDRITRSLQTWGKNYAIVDNGVQAISKLMNENIALRRSGSIIVDTHNLDMDPYYMPSLVRKEPKLAGLRLLCLSDSLYREESQALLKAGYDGVIDTPLNTSQLFSLLEVPSVETTTDNIVSLTHHRRVHSQRQSPKSILLAEQNTTDRRQLENTLRKAGHRVVSVTDGDQALDALERQSFHLAVINLQLPVMNGTQVVKLHRFTTPHRQWVPFIVITNQNTPATLRLCRDLKIRACLFKPVPPTELLEMIVSAPDTVSTLGENRDIESKATKQRSRTHFHHASLLDRKILNALEQLDDDHMFVTDLIKVFNEDCTRILQGMRDSIVHNQADRFISLCGILMDNSGQLGAFALYEMSANIGHINHENFQHEAEKLLSSLTDTATMTTQAFQDYLRGKQVRHIDEQ